MESPETEYAIQHATVVGKVKRIVVKKKHEKIIRRLRQLRGELPKLGPIMRGSVVRLGPHKHVIFSLNKDKKTRLVYLGKEREAAGLECSANYKKLLEIIEEMTILNMALLREHIDPATCLKVKKIKTPDEL